MTCLIYFIGMMKKLTIPGVWITLSLGLGYGSAVYSAESGAGNDRAKTEASGKTVMQEGEASYYGNDFQGKKTASGDTFNQNEMTAAHPTLPLGTKAEVKNEKTGKKVDVTITDRGPYAGDRDIDLSKAAAKKIGMAKDGAAPVEIKAKPAKKIRNK